jgi:hypothetical protein
LIPARSKPTMPIHPQTKSGAGDGNRTRDQQLGRL